MADCLKCQHREQELENLRRQVQTVTDQCYQRTSYCENLNKKYHKLIDEMEELKRIYSEKIEAANRLYYEHQSLIKKCHPENVSLDEDIEQMTKEIEGLWV